MEDRGPPVEGAVADISVEGGRVSSRQRRRRPSRGRQPNLLGVSVYMHLNIQRRTVLRLPAVALYPAPYSSPILLSSCDYTPAK